MLSSSRHLASAAQAAPLVSGIGFSAGGLLFPYYCGVVQQLAASGVLTDSTPVAGASAGSLIAAAVAAGLSMSDMIESLRHLSRDLREHGTRGRLRGAVERTLREVLPANTYARVGGGRLHVAVTRQSGSLLRGELVSEWRNDEDLIACLLTSCHIPFYFDGNAVTRFRDAWCCDGGVTNFLPVPPPPAADPLAPSPPPLRVCCFPAYRVATLAGQTIDIAPDAPADHTGKPVESPYSTATLVGWALSPADDETMDVLLQNGREDARRWVERAVAAARAAPAGEAPLSG